MSPLEGFPQEQTDAPSDSGALRLNLSGGGLCWRLLCGLFLCSYLLLPDMRPL